MDASTSQKIVIVPAEDAKDVAGAGAAPPFAAVETMPPSLAAELHDENDDDSDDTDADTDVGDDDSTHTDKSWVDVDKHDPKVYTPEDALPSQQKHVHAKRPPPVWGSEKAAAVRPGSPAFSHNYAYIFSFQAYRPTVPSRSCH